MIYKNQQIVKLTQDAIKFLEDGLFDITTGKNGRQYILLMSCILERVNDLEYIVHLPHYKHIPEEVFQFYNTLRNGQKCL